MTITQARPVDVAPLGSTEVLQWLSPAPLWDGGSIGAGAANLTEPFIAEFSSDTFVKDFQAMLAGTSGSPADLVNHVPEVTVDGTTAGAFRLYQPLSQRYYAVCAELVCRRPGIPDHTLMPGQKAVFVLRRQDASGGEQAFVATGGGSWVTATADSLLTGEKTYPMHRSPIAPYAESGTTTAALGLAKDGGIGRTLWWGYVPVAIRNKVVPPMADPAGKLADLRAADSTINDPRLDWLIARVVTAWQLIAGVTDFSGFAPPNAPPDPTYGSLYVLLDLTDWLKDSLPPVYGNIANGTAVVAGSANETLLKAMTKLTFTRTAGAATTPISLVDALKELLPYAPLVTGADIAEPSQTYDLTKTSGIGVSDWLDKLPIPPAAGNQNALVVLAQSALAAAPTSATLPPELEGMIREDAGQPATLGKGPTYVIRVVLLHDPCRPLVSEATHPFELAKSLDADAPARKILLQMPDITHMRSFKRGVAIETPPALQRVLNAVTPGILKGDKMSDGGVSLGFICSFSLQIIFMVAFIVMFIFLLLLNIVFFWMFFLKICFPIPVPKSASKEPKP